MSVCVSLMCVLSAPAEWDYRCGCTDPGSGAVSGLAGRLSGDPGQTGSDRHTDGPS